MNGRIPSRIALILGGLLFVLSFFLPLKNHAPVEEMRATVSAVAQSESVGEAAVNCGMAVVITYSYLWVLVVVAAALWNFSGTRSAWLWIHVGGNTIGNLTLVALCATLLLLHDPWLPAKLQWTGAILPVVILLPIWCAALFVSQERRAWVVIALGMAQQLLLQVMLTFVTMERAGQAVGFIVGSIGALFVLAGAIGSACFQSRDVPVDSVSK